jgi:hypothetical protein
MPSLRSYAVFVVRPFPVVENRIRRGQITEAWIFSQASMFAGLIGEAAVVTGNGDFRQRGPKQASE